MELLVNKTNIVAKPVPPLLRPGVLFWRLIWQSEICDLSIRELTPSSPATAAIVTVASK
jgi:hypothetical protein